PMLGFHKQMDNRIKLLEEILSFRMQGVEFDNGDMYVDGHKAASDVRDEFVSVTEKLMDELAQCYNVLPQLDINNTRSEERRVGKECRSWWWPYHQKKKESLKRIVHGDSCVLRPALRDQWCFDRTHARCRPA